MKKKISFKKLLGVFGFFILATLSIFAVTEQSEAFSLSHFWQSVREANGIWIGFAFCGTLFFVVFEGFAIRTMVREFGQKCTIAKGIIYSATDIYFSAITPSAIGGQPACAYFMMKDGITGSVCAIALLCGLMMYSVSIIIIGVIMLFICPQVLSWFTLPSKILLGIGIVAQLILITLFYLLLRHSIFLHRLGTWGLRFLKKCHLLRNYEKKQEKLDQNIETYKEECSFLMQRPKLLFKMFVFNFCQRLSLMLVTVFCFVAFTGDFGKIFDVLALQCMVTIGSNCVPLPGAMGIYDLLLLDGFSGLLPELQAVNMELVSRSVSFYSCLIFCGLIVLIQYIRFAFRGRAKKGEIEGHDRIL